VIQSISSDYLYPEVTNPSKYIAGIEKVEYVINHPEPAIELYEAKIDYHNLIRLSGYEGYLNSYNSYEFNVESLILSNDAHQQYIVEIFRCERPDIDFFDRRNNEKYGFFTYIPRTYIRGGRYNIGLLVNEEGKEYIQWTDAVLEVE